MQRGVGAVGQDHRQAIQIFTRLRPQRLQGVHAAAIGLQRDDLAVRARHGGAGRHRQADADGPARQHQPIVRRAAGAVDREFAALRDGLVAHDGLLRQAVAGVARRGASAAMPNSSANHSSACARSCSALASTT
ncbi:hypothetical protein G6F22_017848 [Rhizopus arrhizus]|nr:hypothetical protein G6F22_017848 [Rhizopus arrhizus]